MRVRGSQACCAGGRERLAVQYIQACIEEFTYPTPLILGNIQSFKNDECINEKCQYMSNLKWLIVMHLRPLLSSQEPTSHSINTILSYSV